MKHRNWELLATLAAIALIVLVPQYGVIASFIIVIAYLRRQKDRSKVLQSIGVLKPNNWFYVILLSMICGAAIELCAEVVVNPIIEHFLREKIDLSVVDIKGDALSFVLWIVIGFVLGGLLEEILFRGFLLTRIAKFLGGNKLAHISALLATSFIFGLCHLYQGVSGSISTGFIGFLLGTIFLCTGKNLYYAILTHGFVNFTGLTILYLGKYEYLNSLLFP
jgi:membrane protease YdiL (CAAX protease family)